MVQHLEHLKKLQLMLGGPILQGSLSIKSGLREEPETTVDQILKVILILIASCQNGRIADCVFGNKRDQHNIGNTVFPDRLMCNNQLPVCHSELILSTLLQVS